MVDGVPMTDSYSGGISVQIENDNLQELQVINKGQEETLENMEGMIIKLIERWNRSDETRDRRHEDTIKEINDMSDVLMEIKGNVSRINGRH